MSTIFCPNCGAPNRETAKYCGKCAGLLAPLSPATMVMDYEPERKRRRRRRSGSRRAARPAYRPLTKFEQRGLRLGHGVWDLVLLFAANA